VAALRKGYDQEKLADTLRKLNKNTIKVNDCWLWQGARNRGYGRIRIDGEMVYIHRWIYQELRNIILPDSIKVLHKCDTPNCWQPKHLFEGTQLDNIKDRDAKGRGRWALGVRQHLAKLTDEKVLKIRKMAREGYSNIKIAVMFGVTSACIGNVVNRKTWKHI
jgi:hypothetical protein